MVNWFTGTEGYAQFMHWMFGVNGADWRVLPIEANGQFGFAAYRGVGGNYTLHTLQILTIRQRRVTRLSVFQDENVFASFGLEPLL